MPSPSAIASGTSPQPAQGVRPKAPARPPGEEAPDAGQGGFAALLGLLGGAVPLQEPALAPATPPLPGAADTTDAAAAPAWNWSAATPILQGLQGRSDLPAQAAGALSWVGQPSALSGLLPPQLRRAGALVAETARMDSNALESGEWSEPAQRRAGMGGSAARSGTAAGTAPSAAAAQALAAQGRGARAVAASAAAAPGQTTAHGAAPVAPVPTPAETTAMPARLEGAAGLAALLRSALDAPTLPAPGLALAALAPAAAQTGGDSAAGGRSAGQGTGAGTDGFQPAAQAQADSAPAVPGSETSALLPDNASTPDAITEQMAYWATDNLQNAELTLAHDGQPVEVHVSLDGQQAHVAFRSDQSETRALLDAGTGQLRELLGQEGLVLSGVSVGSSRAQSDAPPRPAQSRSAVRQPAMAIEGEATAVLKSPARAGVPSERKVDLFV